MLPRVFAIEDHRHYRIFPAAGVREPPARVTDPGDEVDRCRVRIPRLVGEADEVGELMIAKQRADDVRSRPEGVGPIEIVWGQGPAERPREDFFIGGRPLRPLLRQQCHDLV